MFGQSIWPPAERPTKLCADISIGVRTKGELFSRLAQATPGATLIAASDCGLSLFDLVEVSVRSGVQLLYLAWSPQDQSMDRVAREITQASGGTRASQAVLAQAIPAALPIWVGIDHAPGGAFCVSRVAEAIYHKAPPELESEASDIRTRDLFRFSAAPLSPGRGLERNDEGSFAATGLVPQCFERLAEAAGISASQLAGELFDSTPIPGRAGQDLPRLGGTLETGRARRFRGTSERAFDASKRA
jgi:hypothetical protein